MKARHRIRTIYAKELIDILRDRRTLIAMIVVPIVLYPLLMLGSIQAVSFQVTSMENEALIVGVLGQEQAETLDALIRSDADILAHEAEQLTDDEHDESDNARSADHFEVRAFADKDRMKEAVRRRKIQLGVVFTDGDLSDEPARTNRVEFFPDEEDMRSRFALDRITELFDRVAVRLVTQRKKLNDLPAAFDQPFAMSVADLSTPSSILGQILPLILILMTITGAIYPAIDLTAGERERGTLESLMVCPVPVIDLIVGKFLVVTTVAIMGATLNLASVAATVYFGGFDKVISESGSGISIETMLLILLCLIPFAVFMSAIMIAVCSYARTFKEAQNYVTPVILAVLIPGGIAAMPATQLDGVMLVMPVGNMVLLAREFLLGVTVSPTVLVTVLLSTSLYAAAAVAVAATIFGQESVVFADSGSLGSLLSRKNIKPTRVPSVALGLLFVALLFPVWFYVQSALSPGLDEGAQHLLQMTAWLMPLLFVVVPVMILLHQKVAITDTLALRAPDARYWIAAVLIGLSAWVPSREISVLQAQLVGVPTAVVQNAQLLGDALSSMPGFNIFFLLAVVPAICEELLFRGFLLSSLGGAGRKWTAIIVSACVFGVFHFFLFKFVGTAALGAVLALLCWQSRSVFPAMLAHFLHNAIGAYSVINPNWPERIGVSTSEEWAHLPGPVLVVGIGVFVAGLVLTTRQTSSHHATVIAAEVN